MSAARRSLPHDSAEPMSKCSVCHKSFNNYQMYEYRGVLACGEHFDEAITRRDHQRSEVIAENNQQTRPFLGLNLTEGPIGRANQEILKAEIVAAAAEGPKTAAYEAISIDE